MENFIEKRTGNNYENVFWELAEKLSSFKTEKEKIKDKLYEEINQKINSNPNLYEKEIIMEMEKEYWDIESDLQAVQSFDNEIQEALVRLEEGYVSDNDAEKLIEKLNNFLGILNDKEKGLSKRKKRILEERERLGEDPRKSFEEMMHSMRPRAVGTEAMRVTTGRNLKRIKNIETGDAVSVFIEKTADTHGGKGAIKKGATYVSESGKRIRKK